MATTREAEGTVRLRLAVRAGAGEVEELELEAQPSLTVGDAAAALARELDAPAAETLTLARTGEELSAGLPLLEAGLRDGDELLLGAADSRAAADACRAAHRGRPGRRTPRPAGARRPRRRTRSPRRRRRRRRRALRRAPAARGGRRRTGDRRGPRLAQRHGRRRRRARGGPVPLPRGALVSAGRTLLRGRTDRPGAASAAGRQATGRSPSTAPRA